MSVRTPHRGFTLIEVLLALTISSLLLIAVVATLNTCIISYKANQQYAAVTTQGRGAMLRMITALRSAPEAMPSTNSKYNDFIKGGETDPATGLRTGYVEDIGFKVQSKRAGNNNKGLIFEWDSETQQLKCREDVQGPLKWYVITRGVTDFRVRLRSMQSENDKLLHGSGGNYDIVEEATIFMTISAGGSTFGPERSARSIQATFVQSVVPRSAVWVGPRLPYDYEVFVR